MPNYIAMMEIPTELQTPEAVAERTHAYYRTISAKGKEVMREKSAQGEIMHKAPLGYKNARDEHGRSVLVADPVTYPLVQRAKELHAQGWSIRRICEEMERLGLRSSRGKVISPMAMWKILER